MFEIWCFVHTLEFQKDEQVGPRSNQATTFSGGKNDETVAVLLWAHHKKAGFSGKDNNIKKVEGKKKRGRPNTSWSDSLKESTELSLEEISRAVEDRTFWRSLIHRIAISQR